MASLSALQIQALPLSWRNSSSISSSNNNTVATIFIPQQQQQQQQQHLHHQHRLPSSPIISISIFAQKKAKKTRKIILKEDMSELGKKGELLEVKAGFFRNYLLPLGKAQIVTPLLLKEMRMEEERIEAEKKRVKEEAQQLALIFQTVGSFKVKRKGGKGKQIFGSVTAQDLVDIIKAQLQRDVDKRIVSLPEIRETGEYIAELKLHPEVTAQVKVNVFAN